jgi:acetylornithine deacetylase
MSVAIEAGPEDLSERLRPETLALLGELVAFDTVSSRSNRALIDYVAARLESLGIHARILPTEDGKKANLWATIGPPVDAGVVLSGHSDVVPVDGQAWQSAPFVMEVRDGRAFGRGAADMKGFIACAITAMERHRNRSLRRPIHLAISYDEEIGCLGAPQLLEWLAAQAPKPALAVIGEPTGMQVVNAHKGFLGARTEILGVESHSGLAHQGVSAVMLAGQAIVLLHTLEAELRAQVRDERFTPVHASISANRIGGGTAVNILAARAWFEWDVRSIPGVSCEDVLERFQARLEREILTPVRLLHPGISARTTILAHVPALVPEPGGAAESLAKQLLGTDVAAAVAFGAEAGQFQRAGMSTVIVGPGSMDQGHLADEFVSLDQLARCEAFLDGLALTLSA